jgi:hypothetical protein
MAANTFSTKNLLDLEGKVLRAALIVTNPYFPSSFLLEN